MRVAVEGASSMTVIGIIWLGVLTLVSGVAVRGLLLTHLPSGIDPFRAVGLHLGAAALIGFILHVLTRGSADRAA
ncbi:hypothetical protein ACH0AC_11020 [Micrococcus luteus]|uniref:hypothetical protein n=1 Tax=Micrococcus luteus TaxID=1270 RepID=UPI0038792408